MSKQTRSLPEPSCLYIVAFSVTVAVLLRIVLVCVSLSSFSTSWKRPGLFLDTAPEQSTSQARWCFTVCIYSFYYWRPILCVKLHFRNYQQYMYLDQKVFIVIMLAFLTHNIDLDFDLFSAVFHISGSSKEMIVSHCFELLGGWAAQRRCPGYPGFVVCGGMSFSARLVPWVTSMV